MKFAVVALLLVCAALLVCGAAAAAGNDDQKAPAKGTQEAGEKYFGVDRNDKEAVEKRIRELSDEKFKELFGDEVNVEDIHFHHSHEGDSRDAPSSKPSIVSDFKNKFQEYAKRNSVQEAIKWLLGLFKRPQADNSGASEQK